MNLGGNPLRCSPASSKPAEVQLAAGGGGEATAGVSGDAAPCARGRVGSCPGLPCRKLVERRELIGFGKNGELGIFSLVGRCWQERRF